MARINLLPWRAERRKEREREFYMTLGLAAAAAVLTCFLWWYWMDLRIDNQQERNAYLQKEIKALDSQLTQIKDLESTRSKLMARKEVIEQLQASRSQMVHLFDELVTTIPEGVRLSSMKQTGDILTLEGVAQSNESVATYMRQLDHSHSLSCSDLQKTEVKGADKKNRFVFGLTARLKRPDAPDDQAGATSCSGSMSGGVSTKHVDTSAPAAKKEQPQKPALTSAGGKS